MPSLRSAHRRARRRLERKRPLINKVDELFTDLDRALGPGISEFMKRQEKDAGITLSPPARLMLILPLYEIQKRFPKFPILDFSTASLKDLIVTMAEEPAVGDVPPTDWESTLETDAHLHRTTLSVIKAFWARFCNIPPFCGEGGEKRIDEVNH